MITLTPGVRLESNRLPGGWLPLNFISVGLGAARYVSSNVALDGSSVDRERATTSAVRAEAGLNVRVTKRLGVRAGAFGVGGEEPEWFQKLGVLPAGESIHSGRFGGYAVVSIRR
jgi:hypothetical protein